MTNSKNIEMYNDNKKNTTNDQVDKESFEPNI